jgi:hypothetical protein
MEEWEPWSKRQRGNGNHSTALEIKVKHGSWWSGILFQRRVTSLKKVYVRSIVITPNWLNLEEQIVSGDVRDCLEKEKSRAFRI